MSRRPRWAAVASALALLAAYGATSFTHAQAANQVMTDPAGDATSRVAANGGTTGVPNEPRADITTASASYETGAIVLSVQAAQPVNPVTDAGW
ncbi:MAG TPA: hypothetical protein VGF00_11530, partial [Acidimicrobiia bacterium]